MDKTFSEYGPAIKDTIDRVFAERKDIYAKASPWGADAVDKLTMFTKQGKLIRGSLVCLGANMYGRQVDETVLYIATALEIVHSSTLIHDDIMDNDETRRHQLTLHKQYESTIVGKNPEQAKHLGAALAICLGNVGYFMAWDILSTLRYTNKDAITQKIAYELSLVGLAQMQDVLPYDAEHITQDDVLKMYECKTGRYTIALPLIVGALLAGQTEKTMAHLEKLGIALGILFQLSDDMLGVFGEKDTIGKDPGSDIREGKSTLYRVLLFKHTKEEEKHQMLRIFGNPLMKKEDLLYIQKLIRTYAIDLKMNEIAAMYQKSAETTIHELTVNEKFKSILRELVIFVTKRIK